MGYGGAPGASDNRAGSAVKEKIEAGSAEATRVAAKDAVSAEATEYGTVTNVVEQPGITNAAAIVVAPGGPVVPLRLRRRHHGRRVIAIDDIEALKQQTRIRCEPARQGLGLLLPQDRRSGCVRERSRDLSSPTLVFDSNLGFGLPVKRLYGATRFT